MKFELNGKTYNIAKADVGVAAILRDIAAKSSALASSIDSGKTDTMASTVKSISELLSKVAMPTASKEPGSEQDKSDDTEKSEDVLAELKATTETLAAKVDGLVKASETDTEGEADDDKKEKDEADKTDETEKTKDKADDKADLKKSEKDAWPAFNLNDLNAE